MAEFSVKQFIFSSSATVYGDVKEVPVTEEAPVSKCTNPYGTTKVDLHNCLFLHIAFSLGKAEEIRLDCFFPVIVSFRGISCNGHLPVVSCLPSLSSLLISSLSSSTSCKISAYPTPNSLPFPSATSIRSARTPAAVLVRIPREFPTT